MKHDIFSLKGKVCVVTKGNQGIGETVAAYIADAGANIAIWVNLLFGRCMTSGHIPEYVTIPGDV